MPFAKRSPRRASLPLLALGTTIVVVATLAIGLGGARSNDENKEKQDVVNRILATQKAGREFAAAHPELIPTRSPGFVATGTPISWSVGIVESGQAPFPGSGYAGRNSWSWDLDGRHVVIYAGALGTGLEDAGRGVLAVLVSEMSLDPVPEMNAWYVAPPGTGPLSITSFDGSLLSVRAETGESFTFDAVTREFNDEDGNPVPTDTPRPTPVPLPTTTATLPPIEFDSPTPTATPALTPTAAFPTTSSFAN